MPDIAVKICSGMDEWRSIGDDRNQLLSESDAAYFFLTWEWLYSWAEVCLGVEQELYIIIFYDKNKLIGVAPFYRAVSKIGLLSIRELRFIGTPNPGLTVSMPSGPKDTKKKLQMGCLIISLVILVTNGIS